MSRALTLSMDLLAGELIQSGNFHSEPSSLGGSYPLKIQNDDDDDRPQTVIEFVMERALNNPEDPVFGSYLASGDRVFTSWKSLWTEVAGAASRLKSLDLNKGFRSAIMLPTSINWEKANLTTLAASGIVVGFDPDQDTQFNLSLMQMVQPKVLFVAVVNEVVTEIVKECQSIKTVVTFAPIGKPLPSMGINCVSWDTLCRGKGTLQSFPTAQDSATIIFSSGTTGEPRAIEYSHAALTLAVDRVRGIYRENCKLENALCWLPLANLFQRVFNLCAMKEGATIYFVRHPKYITEALQYVKPEMIIGVPRFFEKFHACITEHFSKKSFFTRLPLKCALTIGERWTNCRLSGRNPSIILKWMHSAMDKVILEKLRAPLGSRMEYAVSGSAPLGFQTRKFFNAIGVPILEAYGLSENIVPVAVNSLKSNRAGSVGKPVIPGSVRISEDGEVQVKNAGIFSRYVGDSSDNSRFTEDGYLKTGDAGSLVDGFLFLHGRIGATFKCANGRRVVPERAEAALMGCPAISQANVLGHGEECPIALITLEKAGLVLSKSELRDLVTEALKDVPRYDRPAICVVLEKSFTVESGEMTANGKLRRGVILKSRADVIQKTYAMLYRLNRSVSHILSEADLGIVRK